MNTITHNLITNKNEDVFLVAPDNIEWPTYNIHAFDTCCGPGKGIGDLAIPDTIYLLKVTAACFVHDFMWRVCDNTWADFHRSNSVFLHNLLAIIFQHGGWLRHLRCYRAVTYYTAVDTGLAPVFWAMKKGVI